MVTSSPAKAFLPRGAKQDLPRPPPPPTKTQCEHCGRRGSLGGASRLLFRHSWVPGLVQVGACSSFSFPPPRATETHLTPPSHPSRPPARRTGFEATPTARRAGRRSRTRSTSRQTLPCGTASRSFRSATKCLGRHFPRAHDSARASPGTRCPSCQACSHRYKSSFPRSRVNMCRRLLFAPFVCCSGGTPR